MDLSVIDEILASNVFPPYKSNLELIKLSVETQPAVAYWSVIHIVEGLMKQQATLGDKKRYLNRLVGLCEVIRDRYKDHPSFVNPYKSIEDYANDVFLKANDEQELGVSYQSAVKLYLLSAAVYQLLITQNPNENHEQSKKVIKLAKMKAVEAAKLLKQAASAPPPQEETQDNQIDDFGPPVPKDASQDDEFLFQPSQYQPEPAKPASPPAKMPSNQLQPIDPEIDFSKISLGESDLRKAELLTESALYAIKANDIFSGVTGLRQALQHLEKVASRQQSHS